MREEVDGGRQRTLYVIMGSQIAHPKRPRELYSAPGTQILAAWASF